ncbi:retrovirus-related pol polyprotein from transposon TNT 1-94, partial [Tanacetum coccineum]
MMASSPICLLSKASETKSCLWYRRLPHLNFGEINHLARHGLIRGLLKLKFENDHLCSACAMGKSKKKPHKPKFEDTNQEKLYHLHMDLCGPMRVASVNGKKYISVICRDYSPIHWLKAVATACYTQNHSIVRLRHGKTPYEVLHDKPPDLSFFHVFGALYYLTNDSENLGKLQPKADIDFDELSVLASEHSSSGLVRHEITPAIISLGLVPNPPPSILFVPPLKSDWDLLFHRFAPEPSASTDSPSSTTVDQDAPSPIAHMGNDPYFGILILEIHSDQSSSSDSIHTIVHLDYQISKHNSKWTKDHSLENIIGELARPVSIRL